MTPSYQHPVRLICSRLQLRPGVIALSILLLVLAAPAAVRAQPNPLFQMTRDPQVINSQIRAALPAGEKALELVTTAADPETLAIAVQSMRDSYKYLRAAQQSSEQMVRLSKFPDPLLQLRIQRIWPIRQHYLACEPVADAMAIGSAEARRRCTEQIEAAVRALRILVELTF